MNELYNKELEIDGRKYRYDPEYDIYYRVHGESSTFDKYGWIAIMAILIAVVVYLEYFK